MSVQITRNAKIFVTENVDSNGNIIISGLTAANTAEIIVQKDSFSFSQTSNEKLIDGGNLINGKNGLSRLVDSSLQPGELKFNCLLNSARLPYDYVLWNSLISTAPYTNSNWSTTPSTSVLKLLRTAKQVAQFGIIVITEDLTYLIHGCRASNANLSFSLNNIATTSWSCSFSTYTVLAKTNLTKVIVNSAPVEYVAAGAVTGILKATDPDNYLIGATNFIKVKLFKNTSTVEEQYLPVIDLNLDIQNSLEYIENNFLNRTNKLPKFIESKSFNISGTLGVYARKVSASSQILFNNILAETNSTNIRPVYRLELSVPVSATKNIVEIILDGCSCTCDTQVSDTLVNTLNFQLVQNSANENCAIKFYN